MNTKTYNYILSFLKVKIYNYKIKSDILGLLIWNIRECNIVDTTTNIDVENNIFRIFIDTREYIFYVDIQK